ncbi:MAG: DNA repair protein RecN [Clostridiales Family XIII bacterium]|jgi:DNA repair protein RecN (Recombination protein N)|nr:DNA repair protein RecN [Clostridiales Family XIII bacterium]
MIRNIAIHDFATIERLDMELSEGLCVITGETGAGKSVIIEAISLALGSRADSAMVRSGKEKAIIQMIIELPEHFPRDDAPYLRASDDSEAILTREISVNGKSTARINGMIVTLSQLSSLTSKLVDIHGQYDHQSLFKTEKHLELIDFYHAPIILPLKEKIAANWKSYKASRDKLADLLKREEEARRRLDFMRYELAEIRQIDPKPDEDVILRERLAILQNSGYIFEKLTVARDALYDDRLSALSGLGNAMRALQDISEYSKDLDDIRNTISDCYYAIEDLAGTIRAKAEHIGFSHESLDETISRLDKIENLTSKHGGSVVTVLNHRDRLERELEDIENVDTLKTELSSVVSEQETALRTLCKTLTALRKEAASDLETKVNDELLRLNFNNAHFSVVFDESSDIISQNGVDSVEFYISTNAGQPSLPLAKVASGGEMSRMMLAFKAIIGDFDNIPTMIFDEIDSGISGVTASIVGKKLLAMAEKRQIVCVTHLPQIAACGRTHLMIAKSSDDSATYTSITTLNDDERAIEIARLLSGANVTETTLKNARELISLSNVSRS